MNIKAIRYVFKLQDGILYWKTPTKKSNKDRRVKGGRSSKGYYYTSFVYEKIKYHEKFSRLIWVLVHGEVPKGVIDHIDGNTSNDSISNLRDVSRSENLRNHPRFRDGDIIGVFYDKRYSLPWKVQFSIKRQTHYFGRYATEKEAQAVAIQKYGELPQ